MKVNHVYPKNNEDKILKKVEELVKEQYPNVIIKNIKITKINIIVKLHYGQIVLQRSDFK